jgi:hypothetical protein
MKRRTILNALLLFLAAHPLIALAGGPRGDLSGGSPSGIGPDGSQINTLTSVGGSLVSKYGVWTFGPGVTGPTAANPPGPFGSFNYIKLNGRVINRLGEFGIADRTGASQIVVNYGGEVFYLTTENDRIWYQFVNYTENGNVSSSACPPCTVDPTLVVHAAGPNALPPFTPSTDGTTISSGAGCVTSVDGVWCNGAGGTNWTPTLNGIPIDLAGGPPPRFNSLTVSCNGQLFGLSTLNAMFSFLSFEATESYAVSNPSLPTCPIAINVAVTPNPALVVAPVPGPHVSSSTPIGTPIASYVVTTSDGSPYTATPALGTSASWLGVATSGGACSPLTPPCIVTTGVPDTARFVQVQPVSGRNAPGASEIEVLVP